MPSSGGLLDTLVAESIDIIILNKLELAVFIVYQDQHFELGPYHQIRP